MVLTACTPPIVVEISYASTPTPAVTTTPGAAPTHTAKPRTAGKAPSMTPSALRASRKRTPTPDAGSAAEGAYAPPVTGQNPPAQSNASGKVPAFDHIVVILLENHGFPDVIGNPQMPNLNGWAKQYVLLSQYYALRHPSLPNYIGLFSGDTYGITKDCIDCFVNQPNLADRIEAAGRTWKDYQEGMPSPCFVGNSGEYQQKHNPFIYFDDIRTNAARCNQSVVPLTQLDADLAAKQLPNFAFIMPNMCNSGHDCGLDVVDQWLGTTVNKLQSSQALGQNSLIVILFDEYDGNNQSCCGLATRAGGQVPAVLISPMAKAGFNDSTPYDHYSMLKTILSSWNMPDLGNTGAATTTTILEPWK